MSYQIMWTMLRLSITKASPIESEAEKLPEPIFVKAEEPPQLQQQYGNYR
jgi:hypothetical protein